MSSGSNRWVHLPRGFRIKYLLRDFGHAEDPKGQNYRLPYLFLVAADGHLVIRAQDEGCRQNIAALPLPEMRFTRQLPGRTTVIELLKEYGIKLADGEWYYLPWVFGSRPYNRIIIYPTTTAAGGIVTT